MRLGKLTGHRVVQVGLRLPAVDHADVAVRAPWVDDGRLAVAPVEVEHGEVGGLAALLVLRPVVQWRLGGKRNLEKDVVREHGRWCYGPHPDGGDGLRTHRRDSR